MSESEIEQRIDNAKWHAAHIKVLYLESLEHELNKLENLL